MLFQRLILVDVRSALLGVSSAHSSFHIYKGVPRQRRLFYRMEVGDPQDEVLDINEAAQMITFDNHGEIRRLSQ